MAIISRKPWAYVWWLVLLQGILALVVGALLVIMPGVSVTLLVQVLGIYWIITGILALIGIFLKSVDVHWGWLLARGLLSIIGGIFVLSFPLFSAALVPLGLVLILAVQSLVVGVAGIIEGIRGGGWGSGVLGVLGILLAIVLLIAPVVVTTLLIILVGAIQLFSGFALVLLSVRLRHMQRGATAEA